MRGDRARGPAGRPGRGGGNVRAAALLVYEDELILAYDKPVGLPVIAPDGSRARCLLDIASEQVRRRNPKGRAAVVHRIDRDTSGIVVFARNAAGKRLLMSGWDEIVAERLYVALVEGAMGADEGVLDSWLVEDERGFVREAGPRERGAKRAISKWRVIGEGGGLTLLEMRLETGRKHQIRVQLAAVGHPVVGDPRYGRAARLPDRGGPAGREGRGPERGGPERRRVPDRLCLHAAAIELALPGAGASVRIESPAPPEFTAALRGRPEPTADARRPTTDTRHPTGESRNPAADARHTAADARRPTADARRPAADGRRARPRDRIERHDGGREKPLNGRRDGASASRSAARSGAPRARGAPRTKKPSSRT